ncbi:hypothetical protein CONPUDRAFT_41266, partial [Coniophora puteana RWD-64-598 SS2]
ESEDIEYSDEQLDSLVIGDNKVYEHKTLHAHYTTYDLRRESDTINPRSRADIMVLSQDKPDEEDAHPYWYARVLYIFHVNVRFRGEAPSKSRRLDVLLVRWLQRDPRFPCGFEARRLPRISFYPLGTSSCWDFIDPATVVRAAHFLPVSQYG